MIHQTYIQIQKIGQQILQLKKARMIYEKMNRMFRQQCKQ